MYVISLRLLHHITSHVTKYTDYILSTTGLTRNCGNGKSNIPPSGGNCLSLQRPQWEVHRRVTGHNSNGRRGGVKYITTSAGGVDAVRLHRIHIDTRPPSVVQPAGINRSLKPKKNIFTDHGHSLYDNVLLLHLNPHCQ